MNYYGARNYPEELFAGTLCAWLFIASLRFLSSGFFALSHGISVLLGENCKTSEGQGLSSQCQHYCLVVQSLRSVPLLMGIQCARSLLSKSSSHNSVCFFFQTSLHCLRKEVGHLGWCLGQQKLWYLNIPRSVRLSYGWPTDSVQLSSVERTDSRFRSMSFGSESWVPVLRCGAVRNWLSWDAAAILKFGREGHRRSRKNNNLRSRKKYTWCSQTFPGLFPYVSWPRGCRSRTMENMSEAGGKCADAPFWTARALWAHEDRSWAEVSCEALP